MVAMKGDDENHPTYHPQFNSQDANVILCTTENTHFRVPSFVLRNTCGYFRATLSISLPCRQAEIAPQLKFDVFIDVDEKDAILELFLRLICGLDTPKWDSFDILEGVISLAKKWDAPGPLSVIRSAVTAPVFLEDPLRLYVVATQCGWDEEAKLASSYTLTLSIYDDQHTEHLERLPSKSLMALLNLHRRRRDEFKAHMDSCEMFDAGNSFRHFCMGCGEEADNHTWRELKARMFAEMDQRPLGDTVVGLDMEEWPEAIACWSAKCKNQSCGRLNYDKLATLRNVRDCLERLPTST